ncbi:hypothetical protein PAPHI01_1368 [Pancytospora philotis]|nr:hypothetical protein PAPHI01_1368 [Pancytospora philotis]
MINLAVNFLQLSNVLGAANPNQFAPTSSSGVVASGSAVRNGAGPAGASTATLNRLKKALHKLNSAAVLTPIRHSFDELPSAYEKWYSGLKEKTSAALCGAIEEASKLRRSDDDDESTKRISTAFHEHFLNAALSNGTSELLKTFLRGCLSVLRAFSDDCDRTLPHCGSNEWVPCFDQEHWAQYDKLDVSYSKSRWYGTFAKNINADLDLLQKHTVSFCRRIEPENTNKQINAYTHDICLAVLGRIETWTRIVIVFDSALQRIHSLVSEIRTWNLQNDTVFRAAITRILSQYIGTEGADPPNQSHLEGHVAILLTKLSPIRDVYLVEAKKKVASLTQKWNTDANKVVSK